MSSVLLGASKEAQLDDNLGAAELALTDAEVAELSEKSPHADYYPAWFTERMRDAKVDAALGR